MNDAQIRQELQGQLVVGQGEGTGKVVDHFTDKVTRTIKGKEITRNATEDDPAYLIEQDDGDRVLKSHTELKKA
ncbi:DUF2945 domain-containing protein [Devosia pacifica]|nr:DUF2945 domain-containing protein [Devosia pacifica]